jgi:GntR family transcriptional repressor for pyruvate dehydrogenase complex
VSARGFSRLDGTSRSTQVRKQLEDAIRRADYRPGDKLPSERELVEMLGVSRVSVREAICSLEAIGLVEVRHGTGTIVLEQTGREPTAGLSRWMRINRDEVLELLTVRAALDELAGEEAALRHDAEPLLAVRAAHTAFAQAAEEDRRDELPGLDERFHIAIAEASGSVLLRDLLVELHSPLERSRELFFAPDHRAKASTGEHAAILAALVAGDGPAARRAIGAHVESVRALIGEL